MWQRKQTLYLVLAIICMMATKFVPFAIQSKIDDLGKAVLIEHSANASIPIVICIATIVTFCGAAIVLFKKRGVQKILTLVAALIGLLLTAMQYAFMTCSPEAKLSFGIALPFLAFVFCVMAFMGIRADEKLIKSIDRLRD
jgi:peptidoglycan/LPS O-acetylase OafA/YrhL